MIRVKICCIADREEARLAIRYGASAVGLVSEMPSGPGVIDDVAIATIAADVPYGTDTFLLTSLREAAAIAAQHERAGTTTLQLVDHLSAPTLIELRERAPGVILVQVIHVTGGRSIDEAVAVAPFVDAILLDSGNPSLAVKELGGTGRTHDWEVSRAIVEALDRPVYLAGGLTPDNVVDAIQAVRPYGLDLCAGVRTGDSLDEAKLSSFMAAVARAAARNGEDTR